MNQCYESCDLQETERLAELYKLGVLDTPPQIELDALVNLGRSLFNSAICAVSMVDKERLWFKSSVGSPVKEVPRDISFCSITIERDHPLAVNNALQDPRFNSNPLVVEGPQLRSYLGVPIKTRSGHRVGSFCVIDNTPRQWSHVDVNIAREFASLAEALILKGAEGQVLAFPAPSADDWEPVSESVEFKTVWTRDLRDNTVVLEPDFARRIGLDGRTRISKDWFTRQVLDCDRELVYAARSRADGEPFHYQLGLVDGGVLQITERVSLEQLDSHPVKVGRIQGRDLRVGQSPRVVEQAEEGATPKPRSHTQGQIYVGFDLSVALDKGLCVEGDAYGAGRFLDMVHPAHIADVLHVMRQLRAGSPACTLTLDLNMGQGRFDTYLVDMSYVSESNLDGHSGFLVRYCLENPTMAPVVNLEDIYHQEHVKTQTATAGWVYEASTQALHVSRPLRQLLRLNRRSPTLDDLIVGLETFSGLSLRALVAQLLRGEKTQNLEWKTECAGQTNWYNLQTSPLHNRGGDLKGFSGFVSDITESRRAQLNAESSHFTYDLIVQGLCDGVLEFDEHDSLVFFNRNARDLLMAQADHLRLGQSIRQVFPQLNEVELHRAKASLTMQGLSKPLELYLANARKHIQVRLARGYGKYFVLINDHTEHKTNLLNLELTKKALSSSTKGYVLLRHNPMEEGNFELVYMNDVIQGLLPGTQSKARISAQWLAQCFLSPFARLRLISLLNRAGSNNARFTVKVRNAANLSCEVDIARIYNPRLGLLEVVLSFTLPD
ncbi:GAF domain-containing protein [Limnobacter sp.]|uniref:GAF domain-containing protein n=1 Tax=Limnobacter sp. TaxID=2003368 RepID=UPI00351216BB